MTIVVSVPSIRAWADEPLLINPSPLGGINLGGASPEGAPNGNLQVDDDTLVPKYTPGLNTGGMDTSGSMASPAGEGQSGGSVVRTDPLGMAPIIQKIFGGG